MNNNKMEVKDIEEIKDLKTKLAIIDNSINYKGAIDSIIEFCVKY